MGCCAHFAPSALLHVNLLLMLYVGGGLVTSARVKWDPTLYLALRELFPLEYRVSAAVLPTLSFVILVLAHLVLFALRTRRLTLRRNLLILYAMGVTASLAATVAWSAWVAVRLLRWMHSQSAQEIHHAVAVTDHLQPLLEQLAHWHPLPQKVKDIIQEAQEDGPRNLYVLVVTGSLLLVLQVVAALLASISAAITPTPRSRYRSYTNLSYVTSSLTPLSLRKGELGRPRAVYRNGRLELK